MADSTTLRGRAVTLVVGSPDDPSLSVDVAFNDKNSTGIDISGFDFSFTVERTLKPQPNTCDITVYNMAEASRKKLSGAKKLTVSLSAGYTDATSLLYLGEVRAAWTERDGADFLTHLESGDKEKEIAAARLITGLGPKTPISDALNAIVAALRVGSGNVPQVAATLAARGVATLNGGAMTGSAARRMTDLCRSAGLEWSVQNGAVQLLNIGAPLTTTKAFLMSSSSGMIESPTVDSKGIVTAKCLLIPGIVPGVLVNFQSLFVNGGYRVERCKYRGEIFGKEWEVEIEARKY